MPTFTQACTHVCPHTCRPRLRSFLSSKYNKANKVQDSRQEVVQPMETERGNSLLKRRPWPQFVFWEWECWRQACFWVGWPCSQWWGGWGSKWRCMPGQKYKVTGIPAMTLNKDFMTFALRYFSKRNTSHKVWENPMWWFQSHLKILQSLLPSYSSGMLLVAPGWGLTSLNLVWGL